MTPAINIPNLDGLQIIGTVKLPDGSRVPVSLPIPDQLRRAIRQAFIYISNLVKAPSVTSSGTLQSTQANLGNLGLGPRDAGVVCWVTDYGHLLRWTGSGWEWGPREDGSGMLQPFAVAPTATGWHVCDGSTGVKYLKSDGTTGTVDLPNITGGPGAYMLLGSSYVKTITGAQNPISSTPTFTGTPGTTGVNSAAVTVQSGSGVTVASNTHAHPFTPAGTVTTPAITLPGDPIANFGALLYFRQ